MFWSPWFIFVLGVYVHSSNSRYSCNKINLRSSASVSASSVRWPDSIPPKLDWFLTTGNLSNRWNHFNMRARTGQSCVYTLVWIYLVVVFRNVVTETLIRIVAVRVLGLPLRLHLQNSTTFWGCLLAVYVPCITCMPGGFIEAIRFSVAVCLLYVWRELIGRY